MSIPVLSVTLEEMFLAFHIDFSYGFAIYGPETSVLL